MQIDIRTTNLPQSDAVTDHVRTRLDAALGRFETAVRTVNVTLSDVNGPKGGDDMRCQIEVLLHTDPPVMIDERADDLYAAISTATQRAKTAVLRRVDASKPHKMRFNST